MSIEIQIDTEAVSKRLGTMLTRIDHFKRVDIGQGLSEWQIDEMHRHRPFTMRYRAKGLAVTKVRPHSLYEMERSGRAHERVIRYRRAALTAPYSKKARSRLRRKKPPRFYPHTSMRPILREDLFIVLHVRMLNLLEEKIKW
jgi:hypothetical protein